MSDQLTVKSLKAAIAELPDDLPVFFRRVQPCCGNIEEAATVAVSKYSFFGIESPCVIVEPFGDED